MFITTHAAIGAVIGQALPGHPLLAVTLSVMSHFLTDVIPHGDSKLYKGFVSGGKVKRAVAYVTADAVVAMLFILFVMDQVNFTDRRAMTWAIAAGVAPDLLVALYELFKVKQVRWFYRLHFWFHNMVSGKRGDIPLWMGFVMQEVLFAGLMMRMVR